MRNLFHAGKYLALDLASTIVFLVLYATTHNLMLAVALGMALGVGQIGWVLAHRRKPDTMQWMSLFLVLASSAATLLTNDPRFVMFKPTVIYAIVGVVMLKRGWMLRYMPPIAVRLTPELMIGWGYAWSALMFASALLNIVLVFSVSFATWTLWMSVWGTASKLILFAVQFVTMRAVGVRRAKAMLTPEEIAAYNAGRVPVPAAAGSPAPVSAA